jgi:Domain of unknown function (DUF4263)
MITMSDKNEEGTASPSLGDRWDQLERDLGAPGVTLVVAPLGVGRTSFASRVKHNKRFRTAILHNPPLRVFSSLESEVRRRLGTGRPGDLVIIDRFDDLRIPLEARWLRDLIDQKWAENLHILILASRPIEGAREVFEEARRRSHRQLHMYDFYRFVDDLEHQVLRSDVKGEDAEALFRLIQSSSHNLDLTYALIDSAQSRLTDGRSSPPDLLIVPDRKERLRVLPSTALGTSDVELVPGLEVNATPRLIYRSTRGFWLPEADRLEVLINDPGVREYDLQAFFEEHPHLLQGMSYDRVVPHPVLARDNSGPLIPDFMLEPTGGFADVLDLKRPGVPLVTGRADRLHQTAHVTEAIAQVREYAAYFDDATRRQELQDRYGLHAYRPTAAVLIGRDPGPGRDPLELRRVLADLPSHVEIRTYDQLLRQVRRLGRF